MMANGGTQDVRPANTVDEDFSHFEPTQRLSEVRSYGLFQD